MDFQLTLTNGLIEMGWDTAVDYRNNVLLSLHTRRGALFARPRFGSRLHTLGKVTDNGLALARDYCREALQWMVDVGRIVEIAVETARHDGEPNRIDIQVEVTFPDGDNQAFETFYRVV